MSRPIARDDRIHVEYVPTQVVTEFLRSRVRRRRTVIDGIKYPSSVLPGRASYVLFANQDHVVVEPPDGESGETPWLKLVDVCRRSVGLTVQPLA